MLLLGLLVLSLRGVRVRAKLLVHVIFRDPLDRRLGLALSGLLMR